MTHRFSPGQSVRFCRGYPTAMRQRARTRSFASFPRVMATINTASRARASCMSGSSRKASWSGRRGLASRQIEAEAQFVNKLPKTKIEIQDLLTAELRRFADCEEAWGVVVVGLDGEINGATWT